MFSSALLVPPCKDWLYVSSTNCDSRNEENDVTGLSLNYTYSDDDSLYRDFNGYPISILPTSHSKSSDLGTTLKHLLSPSTPTTATVRGPSTSLDSHGILSPTHLGTMKCLQDTSFDDCYRLLTPLVSDPYISPIVRASSLGSSGNNVSSSTPDQPGISTLLESENTSFLDRLRASVHSNSSPDRIQIYSSKPSCLLSPCKPSINECFAIPPVTPTRQVLHNISSTSDAHFATMGLFSPLTPLPEDVTHPQGSNAPISANTTLKRRPKLEDSPSTRPKKARRMLRSSHIDSEKLLYARYSPVPRLPSQSPAPQRMCMPIFTNRTFPESVPISPDFPLFYRRFPASPYLQGLSLDSPKLRHPGGIYNPPRWPLDLYAPRFVKGKGTAKLGLCPICIEPAERGGYNIKLWFAMKFSAFKCYHMQYTHGISASTGLPFSPPVAYRQTRRPEVGKKEKPIIQEGKCHKCKKWVPVEGIKDMESKVKEIFWWKHAASCHHGSNIPNESREDVYERDHIHEKLIKLSNCLET